MRIYVGAFYHTAGGHRSNTAHSHITKLSGACYPHVLESFYYMRGAMLASIRRHQRRIFLDSGAFSAHTLGARITVGEYARFIRRHRDIIEVASNLDVIGPGNERRSF